MEIASVVAESDPVDIDHGEYVETVMGEKEVVLW
jgi:hypothetical protein